jgi:hypothetical protein
MITKIIYMAHLQSLNVQGLGSAAPKHRGISLNRIVMIAKALFMAETFIAMERDSFVIMKAPCASPARHSRTGINHPPRRPRPFNPRQCRRDDTDTG